MHSLAVLVALSALAPGVPVAEATPPGPPPPVMLWAWEWRQDFSFLAAGERAGEDVGVAALLATVRLEPEGPRVIPRRQMLRVPPGTYLEAVVRIEIPRRSARLARTDLDERARSAILATFRTAARRPGVRVVQCDFDAPASLRAAYRALLVEIRAALPAGVGLTMTALGSWCAFDGAWLEGARDVVDDVVPMLFNMGTGAEGVWRDVAATGDLRVAACRHSVGVATYEAHPPLPRGMRRLYLFHGGAWDRDVLAKALEREERSR